MKNIIEKITEWLTALGKFLTKGLAPENLYCFIGTCFVLIVLCILIFGLTILIVKLIKKHKRNKRFPKVLIIKTEVKLPEKKSEPIKKEPKKETKLPRDSLGRFIKRK